MLSGYEIVVFSDEWGRHPFSCQHIMEHFLPGNRLVWVTPTGMRNPSPTLTDLKRIVEKLRKWFSPRKGAEAAATDDRVTSISPFALPYNNVKAVRKINNFITMNKVAKELGDDRRRIVITTLPFTAEYVDKFDADLTVYYIVDDFLEWPGIDRKYIGGQEELLLSKADALLASATKLCEIKAAGEKSISLVPHGVNYEHFTAQSGSETAASVMGKYKTPVIGFFGAISPWLDFELLEKVAAACPDLSFVFIGPIDADITALSSYENVSFLGKVPYSELPNYAQWFDVAMIPFLVNSLTVSVNPLKLLEYFACGLPVVSTELPEVAKYHEHVYLAANADEFVASLRAAVAESSAGREARREIARKNSWQSRAELVSRQLEEALQERLEETRKKAWQSLPGLLGDELEEVLQCR